MSLISNLITILKTNVMEQFKRANVIMLLTENLSPINLCALNLHNSNIFNHPTNSKSQHLYIISDDEIKKGDWYINTNLNTVIQCKDLSTIKNKPLRKKIIATTDTSLIYNRKQLYDNGLLDKDEQCFYKELPQPSQQFIEKYIESYNKGEVITDVLVEYEKVVEMRQGYPKPSTANSKTEWNYDKIISYNLKVNPKDNTITIKKLKDSWNLEEMCSNMQYYMEHCKRAGYITPHQWLKENL
jgi:hypothetical protein